MPCASGTREELVVTVGEGVQVGEKDYRTHHVKQVRVGGASVCTSYGTFIFIYL